MIGLIAKERILFAGHVVLGSTVHVGEKPTVIRYTYINRHAEPPNITKQKTLEYIVIRYDNSGIEQYKNKGPFLLLLCWIDCCGSEGARRKQK